MKRISFNICRGLLLIFCLITLTSSQAVGESALVPTDTTTHLAVIYSTVYPGSDNHLIEVWLDNPYETISGCNLTLVLNNSALGHFSIDGSGDCVVDTTGCLASYFDSYNDCSCYSEECHSIRYEASRGVMSPPIPAYYGGYRCLFKINMDACCIPDSTTDRSTFFSLVGSLYNGAFTDIPYYYHQGDVMLWWSVPGDANGDSVVNMGDGIFILNYLFKEGPLPCICEAADCNADNAINLSDQIYLYNYLFRGGPAPLRGEYSCVHNCRP